MQGRFITLEGGEGTGKSTQAALLAQYLRSRKVDVVLSREPGGSAGAEQIRTLLVQGAPERWDPLTETLLFLAARTDHVRDLIQPALARGAWVVCDRFSDSTVVYQGLGRGLGMEVVKRLQGSVPLRIVPDLTIVLDLPPSAGLRRARWRAAGDDRFESFGEEFHGRLAEGFRQIAAMEPERCILVEASPPVGEIAAEIQQIVQRRFFQ